MATIAAMERLFSAGHKPTYQEAIAYIELLNARRRRFFRDLYGRGPALSLLMSWNWGTYRDGWFINQAWIWARGRIVP